VNGSLGSSIPSEVSCGIAVGAGCASGAAGAGTWPIGVVLANPAATCTSWACGHANSSTPVLHEAYLLTCKLNYSRRIGQFYFVCSHPDWQLGSAIVAKASCQFEIDLQLAMQSAEINEQRFLEGNSSLRGSRTDHRVSRGGDWLGVSSSRTTSRGT
jgi:hypothetical protein